jgi:hypothetical protein
MSRLGNAVGSLVEVLMDWETRLTDLEVQVGELEFPARDDEGDAITAKLVKIEEWERLLRIESAAKRLVANYTDGHNMSGTVANLAEALEQ